MFSPYRLVQWLRSPSFWANVLRVALILLPIWLCAMLVRDNATDTRFYDDWMLAETLLKFREGTLTWHDIVAVQMEHRLAVPRLLIILLHQFTKDMRVENILTFVLLSGMFWNLIWLLRRVSLKGGLAQWWLPAALMSLTLFSPIQYQTLLWGCTFTSILPGFFLSLAMVSWWSSTPRWLAFTLAALSAIGGMMSFASALNIWPLMLLAILLGRSDMPWPQRRKYAIAWASLMAVSLALYFHNFTNAVRPEFAYNQGGTVTMQHSIGVFLGDIGRAVEFVLAVLGCHLGRGWHQDNIKVSQIFGGITVLLFGTALALILRRRLTLPERLSRALPWIILTLQAVQTGLMIGMGRLWVGRTLVQAVTARYCAYELYATVGLIALSAMACHGLLWEDDAVPARLRNWNGRKLLAPIAATALIAVQLVEWSYGSQMMQLWHFARLQGVALLKFIYLTPNHSYLGKVEGGDGEDAARLAMALDKHRLLYPAPLKGRRLDSFKIMKQPLKTNVASFDRLVFDPVKGMLAEGYSAFQGDRHPADAVLLTSRKRGTHDWRIFGVVQVDFSLGYLHLATQRDLEFISNERWNPETAARWNPKVLSAGPPPDPGDEISAWALDVTRNSVNRIPEGRSSLRNPAPSGTIIYPGKPPTTPSPSQPKK